MGEDAGKTFQEALLGWREKKLFRESTSSIQALIKKPTAKTK